MGADGKEMFDVIDVMQILMHRQCGPLGERKIAKNGT